MKIEELLEASYDTKRKRRLFSGDYQFMLKDDVKQLFAHFDVEVEDTGRGIIKVAIDLSDSEANMLGKRLLNIEHKQPIDYAYDGYVTEGFREKTLSGILSLGLAFASQVDASEVYVYTDNNGDKQVVVSYDEVPKGKVAYVVDVGDLEVKKVQSQVRQDFKAEPVRKVSDETRRQMFRTDI